MFNLNRRLFSGVSGTAALLAVLGVVAALSTARPAVAAITTAPTLSAPGNGTTLSSMAPALGWSLPAGATQVQLQITPFENDGPGVNMILNATSSFDVPAPPDWYGLLPDMTYAWQVRATDATIAVSENDASWGPWAAPATFHTPKIDISSVSLYDPTGGTEVTSAQPVLSWSSASADVYYWEVQVSTDAGFGADSFLYWALVHGDVIYPNNAYTIPSSFPLQAGATYYWRVRPRVQGDGAELPWTSAASFKTPAEGALSLTVTTPTNESIVGSSTVTVSGQTKPGAFITIDDQFVTANATGGFTASVALTEGINTIEVIASDVAGDVVFTTVTVSYLPGSGLASLQDGRDRRDDSGPSLRDLFRAHLGNVNDIGVNELTLKDRNGRVATVLVDDRTRYHQPGKRGEVSFEDVKKGMRVGVFGMRVRPGDESPIPAVPTGSPSATATPAGSATATATVATAAPTATATAPVTATAIATATGATTGTTMALSTGSMTVPTTATVIDAHGSAALADSARKAEKDSDASFTLQALQVVLPRVRVRFAHRIGEITAISDTFVSIKDRRGVSHTGEINADTKMLPTSATLGVGDRVLAHARFDESAGADGAWIVLRMVKLGTPRGDKTPAPQPGTPTASGTPATTTTTPTHTSTPTATSTAIGPTATPTSTNTLGPTATPTSTNTPEPTATPTSTNTPEPTAMPTSTNTPQPTVTPTNTSVPTETATPTGP